MRIKNIKITDFKSIYGTQEFNFENLDGLVKLSGPIGAGKTTLGEAILYGLYGTIKGQTNNGIIAWNTKTCQVELNIVSKNRDIHIIRNVREPLIIEVNGKTLAASNKRDTQSILEEDLFDVPKLAVQKMCIISFNAFNSLAAMSAGETKQFLDEIFGFKLFSEYNNEIINERKIQQNESIKLEAIYNDTLSQITNLKNKKEAQKREAEQSIDIETLTKDRENLIDNGKTLKEKHNSAEEKLNSEIKSLSEEKKKYTTKKIELGTYGKQEKTWLEKFQSGVCPTCGNTIDNNVIEQHKIKMLDYAKQYKEQAEKEAEYDNLISNKKIEYKSVFNDITEQINNIKTKIRNIDSQILIYQNNIQTISDNYDDLISEYEIKSKEIKEQIDNVDREIGEWNDMNELFTKTLRYNLLDTLIPHINKSIKYYITKLDQPYTIKYDQEFKPHILVDTYDKEISYNNLSTGQRKSLDMAIIFGILQNIIANVDFNIFFLDELFSNLDSDSRNVMLGLLKESLSKCRTIFVINHAEMNDDFFNHKIRVHLDNKKINTKKNGEVIVKSSKYINIF